MNQIASLNQNRNVGRVQGNFQSELSAIVASRTSLDSIESLGFKLTPSRSSDMIEAMQPILSMPSRDQGEAGELAAIQGFCIALDGLPLQIVIEVRDDFLKNNVKGQSLDFRPSPPRFKKTCEEKLYQSVLNAMIAAGPFQSEEAKPVEQIDRPTEADRAARVEKVRKLLARTATENAA